MIRKFLLAVALLLAVPNIALADIPAFSVSGTITNLNDTVTVTNMSGQSGCGILATGGAGSTATLEASVNGTTWAAVKGTTPDGVTTSTTFSAATTMVANCGGLNQFRVRLSAVVAGTYTVTIFSAQGPPLGVSVLAGAVTANQGTPASAANAWPVKPTDSGGVNQLAINATGAALSRIDQTTPGTTNGVQLTAGTAIAGKVGIDQTTPGTTNAVQVTTASPGGATGNPAFSRIQDGAGTTLATVTGANALKTDGSAVTQPTSCTAANCQTKITDSGGTNQLAVDAAGNASVNLGKVGGSAVALGQTVMASSVPVTVASNQSALPVTHPYSSTATGQAATATGALSLVGKNPSGTMDPLLVDGNSSGVLRTTTGGNHVFVLTSASATSCTQLGSSGVGRLVQIYNTGPATTVFPIFYDDTVCTTQANVRFGDFTTITIGSGQVVKLDVPLGTALSYKLSGALSATQNLIITTYGLGF